MYHVVVVLILLHGPDGGVIEVNPEEITTMRPSPTERRGHFDERVHCLISTTDGKNAAVIETCDAVKELIAGSHK